MTDAETSNSLTPIQRDILEAIRNLTRDRGRPPTLREVAAHVKISSTGALSYQYRRLEAKGYIRRDIGRPRSIEVIRLPDMPPSPAEVGEATLILPTITDDSIEGYQDRLGIETDARALAALVASRRLQPPLAIGLYGEWGSGKTFFMKRVEACIKELTATDAADDFCSEIEPVWFSAWHYSQGNLWASLLHHVFASLNHDRPKSQLALAELMTKVQSAQQVTSELAAKVDAATIRLEDAADAVDAARERQQRALHESSQLRTKDLWDAIKLSATDQHLKDQVTEAANSLGLYVATDGAEDLERAAAGVVELASRARVLATVRPWYRSPLAFAFYAAVIVGALGLLLAALVRAVHPWMGTAITQVAQLAAVGSAVAGWIIRQGTLARRFIFPAEILQRRLEQRLAEQQLRNECELEALKQEADAAGMELVTALQQRVAAEQQLADAEKERAELTGSRLLRQYLAERASSGDYEHYLGVVALAHRDLRDLEGYLRASVDEEEGLDRIVLYIDDLDRCDPDVVVEVLDGIHLLLALQLFVVIVGVDPRWLKRSLRERHPALLGSTPSEVTWASPADYLEKIFQVTYSLPRMSAASCANLLIEAARDTQSPRTHDDQLPRDDSSAIELTDFDASTEGNGQPLQVASGILAQALILDQNDIEALRDVAPLVSTSPRRAKRFLNTYLVIRARALGDPVWRNDLHNAGKIAGPRPGDTLLVLMALLLGLPETMAASIDKRQLMDNGHIRTLGAWLEGAVQTAPEEQARLREFLNSGSSAVSFPIDVIMKWLPLARPYLSLGLQELLYPNVP